MYDYFVEENGIYLAAGSPVIKLTHKDSDEADGRYFFVFVSYKK